MAVSSIESVRAWEIVDCRLEPTLRVEVRVRDGTTARADVPSGRSTGRHEATTLRDGGDRYRGKGVRRAVENVHDVIEPALIDLEVTSQRVVDDTLRLLDDTDGYENVGGNAITGASLAVLKAGAAHTGLPLYRYLGNVHSGHLPMPLFDMIEGGELAATDLDFQEHQLVPVGADSFSEALRMSAEVYYELGDIVTDRWGRGATNVGYEGGYTPRRVDDPREAFDAELEAAEECGYGGDFSLGIDAAATHFYDAETDTYEIMGESWHRGELIDFYEELVADYPLVTIEDPLHEDDFEGYSRLAEAVDVQIVGDDLFVTNRERLERGIEVGAANALLLKVNQVGTFSRAADAATVAHKNGYSVQVSERSGQTADTWLADLAVGLGAEQIKTGVTRGERTEQYNRLLEIEAEMGDAATVSQAL